MRAQWGKERDWYKAQPEPKASYNIFLEKIRNGVPWPEAILSKEQLYARRQQLLSSRSPICIVLDDIDCGSDMGK